MIINLKPYPADTHSSVPVSRTRQAGAWYDQASVKVGCEISSKRYFYKPKALRPLGEIRGDLLKLQDESKVLLQEIKIIGGE